MRVYFTALEKIILQRAGADGFIKLPREASEGEVWLGVLLHLEFRGYVGRVKGDIPMLPFCLTQMGRSLQHALEPAPRKTRVRMKIRNKVLKK